MVQPLCPRASKPAESKPGVQIQACGEFTSETSHPSRLLTLPNFSAETVLEYP